MSYLVQAQRLQSTLSKKVAKQGNHSNLTCTTETVPASELSSSALARALRFPDQHQQPCRGLCPRTCCRCPLKPSETLLQPSHRPARRRRPAAARCQICQNFSYLILTLQIPLLSAPILHTLPHSPFRPLSRKLVSARWCWVLRRPRGDPPPWRPPGGLCARGAPHAPRPASAARSPASACHTTQVAIQVRTLLWAVGRQCSLRPMRERSAWRPVR